MSESFARQQFIASFMLIKAIILLSIFCPIFTWGQQSNQIESQYAWFDGLMGVTNSGVYEGEAYYNDFKVRNGRHQFFESTQFQIGSVEYNGEMYFNLALKYDIFNDKLILRNQENYGIPPIVIDSELLTKFWIQGAEFENFHSKISDVDSYFFEIILRSNSYSLLKEYKKKLFIKTEDEILYHEFKDDFNHYLRKDDAFYRVKSVKDLSAIFPEQKKLIKLLDKQYKEIRKSDFSGYLKSILTDLQKELSTTN